MRILVQPDEGVVPLVKAIGSAKKSVEIAIFRFDNPPIERALKDAVERGVPVRALIAHFNRGGEDNLRRLEMRLLAAGVTVARTANDLLRYHYKLVIVDRDVLFLLAYNFTSLDAEHSRSFGVVSHNQKLVQEAAKLFEADTQKSQYTPGHPDFLVSPLNSRAELAALIQGARKQVLIYDLKISDPAMIRLIEERVRAGVDIRILGRIKCENPKILVRKPHMRLHARVIIRDGNIAFVGSQSLRRVELDGRREVGLIFRDRKSIAVLTKTFEGDWTAAGGDFDKVPDGDLSRAAKKVAKVVTKDLPPITHVLEQAVKEVVGGDTEVALDAKRIEETVKDAVKEAVKEIVRDVVEEAVGQNGQEVVLAK